MSLCKLNKRKRKVVEWTPTEEKKNQAQIIKKHKIHDENLKLHYFKTWIHENFLNKTHIQILTFKSIKEYKSSSSIQKFNLEKSQANWSTDICTMIASFFNFKTRCHLKSVAYIWNETSKNPSYWKGCTLQTITLTHKYDTDRNQKMTYFHHISSLARHCKTMRVNRTCVEFFELMVAHKWVDQVETLILEEVTMTTTDLIKLYQAMPKLTTLQYKVNWGSHYEHVLKQVFWGLTRVTPWQKLVFLNITFDLDEIKPKALTALSQCHTLVLQYWVSFDENDPDDLSYVPMGIISAMPMLIHLVLVGYNKMTDEQTATLKISHPQLQVITANLITDDCCAPFLL